MSRDHGTSEENTRARRIASEWHGGGGSGLYVLSSTGAIVLNDQGMEWLNVRDEVQACLTGPYQDIQDNHDLNWLLNYIDKRGSRGPIEGWGELS